MPDLKIAIRDTRPMGYGVCSDWGWYRFASPAGWDAIFDPTKHVLACTRRTDLVNAKEILIPYDALVSGSYLMQFYQQGGMWIDDMTLNTPENYLMSVAQRGSAAWRF